MRSKEETYTRISWSSMNARCFNPKSRRYDRYGGRGITVCERWKSFDNFLADMGIRPPGCTIDRIDTYGNYEPENCKWSSPKAQQRNRRINRIITHLNESLCLSEWSERTGIHWATLDCRLKRGWTPEEALTVQPTLRKPHVRQRAARPQQIKKDR